MYPTIRNIKCAEYVSKCQWNICFQSIKSFLCTSGKRFFFNFYLLFLLIYLFYFTILYWFCHTLIWICHECTCVPHSESPSHLPPHPIHLGHPSAPCIMHKPGLVICFTYDILHVSMPFSHIIPPSPSPTESKRLFNTSVSLLLSCIQGYRYLLSKFHIYALVYCIGVFLSGLLHSV